MFELCFCFSCPIIHQKEFQLYQNTQCHIFKRSYNAIMGSRLILEIPYGSILSFCVFFLCFICLCFHLFMFYLCSPFHGGLYEGVYEFLLFFILHKCFESGFLCAAIERFTLTSSLSLNVFFFFSFFWRADSRFKAALYGRISLLKCDKE